MAVIDKYTNEEIENPFRDVLYSLVGVEPPKFVIDQVFSNEFTDDEITELQEWCVDNLGERQPSWATGLSMIESADLIIKGAFENGNIFYDFSEADLRLKLIDLVNLIKEKLTILNTPICVNLIGNDSPIYYDFKAYGKHFPHFFQMNIDIGPEEKFSHYTWTNEKWVQRDDSLTYGSRVSTNKSLKSFTKAANDIDTIIDQEVIRDIIE